MPAPRKAITIAAIASALKADLPPQGVVLHDIVRGLGLRIRSKSASWIFVYRPRGMGRAATPRRVTLGHYPTLNIEGARIAAQKLSAEIATGKDPSVDIRVEKRRQKHTVEASLKDYAQHIVRRQLTGTGAISSALTRGLDHLKDRDVASLTRQEIVDAVERIEKAGRQGAADYFRRHVRTWLERELQRGVVQHNVLAGMRRPRKSRAEALEKKRAGRSLTDDEIRKVWLAAGQAGPFGSLVQFCLLTGSRRNEASLLTWGDIVADGDPDPETGQRVMKIVIPASRMKSGRPHEIPINGMLADLLDAQPKHASSDVVFCSLRTGGVMGGWSQLLARLHKASNTSDWTLHDLRRSFRSRLSDLGVPFEVAETAIAHARSDLHETYDRSRMWDQRKAAAQAFSDWLEQMLKKPPADSNVVPLQPKKAG